MKTLSQLLGSLAPVVFLVSPALASTPPVPACLGHGQLIEVDDAQVVQWKATTPNQTLKRAHVDGTLTRLYPNHSGHAHFEIQVGPASTDTLEVVYNVSFGALPALHVGMRVEACGDYITSNAATSRYPASPDGAIIHWIHRNPSGQGHDSGFLILDGALFGTSASGSGG